MQNISALICKSKEKLELILDEKVDDNVDYKLSNETYPFEYFMNVSNRMKSHKFYEDINLVDIVYGTITRIYPSKIEICLICTGGTLVRDIYNLKIPAICSSNELPKSCNFSSSQSFRRDDLVKCFVIHVERNRNVELSMNANNPLNKLKQIDLGLYSYENLPKYHRILRRSENSPKTLSDLFVTNSLSSSLEINERLKFFQLKNANFSLLDLVNKIEIKSDETAKNLRNSLLMKESKKFVVRGVEYFKKSKYNEALQCYNHALSINESNVDALVARGALRATLKAFELSIIDLEKAVKLEPNHKNAAAYLSKTIMAYSKSLPPTEIEKVEQLVKKQFFLNKEMNETSKAEISNPNYFIVISDDELQNSSNSKSHKYKELSDRKKKNKKEKSHRKKTISIDITSDNSDSSQSDSSEISHRTKHKKSKLSSRKSKKLKRKQLSSSSNSESIFYYSNKSINHLNNSSRKRKRSSSSSSSSSPNDESPNRTKVNHSFSGGYNYRNDYKDRNLNRKSLWDYSSERHLKSKLYEINQNHESRIVGHQENCENKTDSNVDVNRSLNVTGEGPNISEVDNSKLKAADEQIKNIEDFISFLKNNKKS